MGFHLAIGASRRLLRKVGRTSGPMSASVFRTRAVSRACLTALLITLSLINVASAQTVWSGLTLTFTKVDGTDPQLAQNQDRIANNVWITRGQFGGGLLNAASECDLINGCTYTHNFSPQGTEWATARMLANSSQTIAATNWQNLSFINWEGAYNNQVGAFILDPAYRDAVVHLIADNIYLDLRFIGWTSRGGGGFSYQRAMAPGSNQPAGDYNHNGIVDAADYVVWRNGLGTTYTQADYVVWREHFGQTLGSGLGASSNNPVPEPSSVVMLFVGMLVVIAGKRTRNPSPQPHDQPQQEGNQRCDD
jgi:hypothetical protein